MYKICHVTSVHSNQDGRIFHKECSSLAKNTDYEVFLVAPGNTFQSQSVQIIGFSDEYKTRFSRFFKTAKIAINTAIKVDADVYHLHDPELLFYSSKLINLGKKVIFDSHEDYPQNIRSKHWIPKIFRPVVAFLYARLETFFIKKITGVVSVTPQITNRFSAYAENVALITNFPIYKHIEITKREEKTQRSICFPGSIAKGRLHHLILDVIDDIDNIIYYLAGPISDQAYYESLKKHPAFNKVVYYGVLDHAEIADFYMKSNIGIVLETENPTNYGNEGSLGITKLFEYMMYGLPVICNNFSLYIDIIEKHECGICVDYHSHTAIKNAINLLIENKGLSERMGHNGQQLVRELYNWKQEEKKLFDFYKKVTNEKLPR